MTPEQKTYLQRRTQITEAMVEAGAQALADLHWHPPQKLPSLSPNDQKRFRLQSRAVLEAATNQED